MVIRIMAEIKEGEWLGHVEWMWHETSVQGYNEQSAFRGLYVYVYQAAYTVIYPLVSQMTIFTLSDFTAQSL